MKKNSIVLGLILVAGFAIAAVGAGLYTTGWGGSVTATTAPVQATGFVANGVSVYNAGTNAVFALVNCSTGVLATRITAGSAIEIPANMSYTFDCQTKHSIWALCYATTNSTSVINIGAF